ncbi:hypothetical protein DWF04_006020 [Cereibacter sphaeroides f. sp. denitrificans]|nr:hypothetical protein DWF04_06185 [Cereibacter sphaeroides f. sp. denitrificans]
MKHDAICDALLAAMADGRSLTPWQASVLEPLRFVPIIHILQALADLESRGEIEAEGPIECGAAFRRKVAA